MVSQWSHFPLPSISQFLPKNLSVHMHVYVSSELMHVPPFRQGEVIPSGASKAQLSTRASVTEWKEIDDANIQRQARHIQFPSG